MREGGFLTPARNGRIVSMGSKPVMGNSKYHYKVFTHLWAPAGLEEARLIVLSKFEMSPAEIKAVVVRSGRAIAGESWIELVGEDEFEAPARYETPEDYVLLGVLPETSPGTMPPRPTDRDPTVDYPFQQRP